MKAQMKAIVASAVVIALCLAAVGGVTYSWFSDSEESTIDITAGKIDVTATWGDIVLSSYNYTNTTTITQNDTPYSFPFDSGKAEATGTTSPGLITKTITVENMVPGDSISFKITNVKLTTDVNVLFSYGYSIQTMSGPDANLFEVSMTAVDGSPISYSNAYKAASGSPYAFEDASVKLSVKTDAGNKYMGSSYKIQFFVKAVQANASMNITPITDGDNVIDIQSGETEATAKIAFDGAGHTGESLSVSMIPGTESGYTTTETGDDTILGGISVTTSADGSALQGVETTISFEIPGQYAAADLNIYHNGDKIISAGQVVDTFNASVSGFDAQYNSTTDKTTVTFKTTLGFSKYHVTGNFPVASGGVYFKNIKDAMNYAQDGTVVLLKDIKIDSGDDYATSFCGTLEGNNHTITVNPSYTGAFALFYLKSATDKNIILKNFKYQMTGEVVEMCYIWGNTTNSTLTFDNVDVLAKENGEPFEAEGNCSAYCSFISIPVTFIDCDNYASYYSGSVKTYAGIFVGGTAYGNLTFTNCTNNGDSFMSYPGLFLGNPSYWKGTPVTTPLFTLTITNCTNNGAITGTKSAHALGGIGSSYCTWFDEQISSNLQGTGSITTLDSGGLDITAGSDGSLNVTKNESADKHIVWYSAYATVYGENDVKLGTKLTNIGIELSDEITLYTYKMRSATTEELSNGTIAWIETLDDAYSYYINDGNKTIVVKYDCSKSPMGDVIPSKITLDKEKPTISISCYDNSGTLMNTKVLSW